VDVRRRHADCDRHHARDGIGSMNNLSVSFDERIDSRFVLVDDTGTRQMFGYKPDLKLVPAKDGANQQVIGSVVAARRRGTSRLAAFVDDEFVRLQQTKQLNGRVFASSRHASDARCLGNIVSHGDGHSTERLNAFRQLIHKLRLLAEVLVEEKVELVKRRTGHLPMVLLVHVP
jgi:hypothetical protein